MSRGVLLDGQLQRPMRAGDGSTDAIGLTIVAADANATLSASGVAGGGFQYTGFTAGRNLTADTGANYAAAFPDMDIGDSKKFLVSITQAFAGTLVTATGITLAGKATVVASGLGTLLLVKTAAATFTLNVL